MVIRKGFGLLVVMVVIMTVVSTLWAGEETKIDINTASVEELATLTRIGVKSAQKIVEYRETHGLFKHPEEITKVSGVGKKVWEINKDRIIVTGGPVAKTGKKKS